MPSNGEGLQNHLGAKLYWPIYKEAEKLNCSLDQVGEYLIALRSCPVKRSWRTSSMCALSGGYVVSS